MPTTPGKHFTPSRLLPVYTFEEYPTTEETSAVRTSAQSLLGSGQPTCSGPRQVMI